MLSVSGLVWSAIWFFEQHHRYFGLGFLALAVGVGYQQYYLATGFARQLLRLEKKDPVAVHRYLHQWWICKNPSTCPRCKGWLGGLVVGTGAWIGAVIVYGFDPVSVVSRFGLGPSFAIGMVLVFLTPIHGMLGRLGRLAPESWWDSNEVLGTMGGLSALAAPILASIALLVYNATAM